MPELPDLVYIEKKVSPLLLGRSIVDVQIKQPVVVRTLVSDKFEEALVGQE